jgi:hypothetical protein
MATAPPGLDFGVAELARVPKWTSDFGSVATSATRMLRLEDALRLHFAPVRISAPFAFFVNSNGVSSPSPGLPRFAATLGSRSERQINPERVASVAGRVYDPCCGSAGMFVHS